MFLFVSLPFVGAVTQRPDIWQIASREHSLIRWYREDWCSIFESVWKILMDLFLIRQLVRQSFFLAILTGRIAQI